MRLPPLVQHTWDSPGSAPQGGQFGFVYDHSKVVALQIVVGNMLDVHAVEKPPENSPPPAAFHKNAFRSGIDKSLLVLLAAARSRLGGAARFRERRWHGTDATLRLRCQRRQCRP